MENIIEELTKLDNILIFVGNQYNHSILEEELKKNNLYNIEQLIFLQQEGFLKCTNIPISYRLTQKGIVFISNGGFEQELKRKNIDRKSNLIYLLSSPLLAFSSLILSIFAIYFSLTISKNKQEQPLNFTNEIKVSIPPLKDTNFMTKKLLLDNSKNNNKSN